MSLRQLIQRPVPAGYRGGGSTGYQKVALEANLNVTEMCQIAVDIGAVSSPPLVLDGAGDRRGRQAVTVTTTRG